jgi:predicted AAA+ superfamily ATPase
MAITNQDRITKGLNLLRAGLAPYIDREFTNYFKNDWDEAVERYLPDDRNINRKAIEEWEIQPLMRLMWEAWNDVFKRTLGFAERSLLSELRDIRNNWAHQKSFTSDDTDRALDTMSRMLSAISAPQADELNKMKLELRRLVYDEQVRSEKRKSGGTLIDIEVSGNLKPWREVITPHPDVASGRYQQAEFAADLWQVHIGEATDEYQQPSEFFRRTYLTESLKKLLVGAVQRICDGQGDPVVQLQTNFGGGKTHSMLALYHLFSGVNAADLPGIDNVMAEAKVNALKKANRVVLVGNKISPGNPSIKPDGTEVRTLWGEMAWQLGGKKAYNKIAKDDELATNPGDTLRELFNEYGPCLILIDEWVAYARQLHDQSDLPAGGFETQFSFAQALTESAKLAKNCLLVVSLPASDTAGSPHTHADDVEVGGIRGREALDRLRNVVGRLESSWRPATAEEGFEIVRRRLFEPLGGEASFKQRDVTARAFGDLYRNASGEFPSECNKSDYEKRIQAAYPIHPEIFDRLYEDWSTQPKFQRTRGVLRLMAAVIHSLWEKDDRAPLIMPSTMPIDDSKIQNELTRYLSDNWVPIIESDVDGPNSLPKKIDSEVPNLGRIHATRRVARTIYIGSAPKSDVSQKGIEDRRIRLGCVMPGESTALFGDALRRLASSATYLYQDGPRAWYSTQPTVTKLADDRAEQLKRDTDKVFAEIESRVRGEIRNTGDFSKIHPMPRTTADVPDDIETRLVILSPTEAYSKEEDNSALVFVKNILESRGNSPRIYRNALVFLAADKIRLQELDESVRRYLAWKSVVEEQEVLNLDAFQKKQAQTQMQTAEGNIKTRLPEAYQWLLVPGQKDASGEISWQAMRISSSDSIAIRVMKKLRSDESIIPVLAPTMLRKYLDEIPLWRGNHVAVKQLIEDFYKYLYLPRVLKPDTLLNAMMDGVKSIAWETETFAFAEMFDQAKNEYKGVKFGEGIIITSDDSGLIIKSEQAITAREKTSTIPNSVPGPGHVIQPNPIGGSTSSSGNAPAPQTLPKRFYGSIELDPLRVNRDAGKIAEEVIAHLNGLIDANVSITLEISAEVPSGVSDQIVRIVSENCRSLNFKAHGFEKE